jgi:UDP-3-O-[3-hydroxymyristoyl] N-acetylglucosamine deacetylase/3-hydroxyacyl-[acyl-carrier-protein] dehydratase
VLSRVEDPENWGTLLLKIDNAKFKYKVTPGDQLILKMELLQAVRRGICLMYGAAYVGSKLVSECELTAQIVRNQPLHE